MSRLTSAQVISLGEYLEPDFDSSTLTVSQLLGVLGFHNIRYPTPYTKGKLVQVFIDEIKPRASKFKRERIKKENRMASDDGIMDGITGEPLNGKTKGDLTRRSSRRLSGQSNSGDPPTRPEPPKRRRSSAQPALGGTSRRKAVVPTEVTLVEESEPDEDDLPVKKVGRTRKKATAGTRARRISHVSGEESGWEDNNIFQSGAESSSPIRPSPVVPRISRGALGQRRSRKSMSAPPQMSDSSSPLRPLNTAMSPPESPFQPILPSFSEFRFPHSMRSRFTPVLEFKPIEPVEQQSDDAIHIEKTIAEETEPSSQEVQNEEDQKNEEDDADEQPLTPAATDLTLQSPTPAEIYQPSAGQIVSRIVVWFMIVASAYATWNYKLESASIGFCERGSNTSQALEIILAKRLAASACNREGHSLLQSSLVNDHSPGVTEENCPLPPLIPLPEASACTPCPEHASCSQHNVLCDTGYLLKPHFLLSFIPVLPSQSSLTTQYAPHIGEKLFNGISAVCNGLPLFGSVALPSRCVEDPNRKRHIGNLGKAIEARLAKERGRRLCRGDRSNLTQSEDSTEQAVKWGIEIGKLKEDFKKTANPILLSVFDDMFTEAIQQLTQWGGVFVDETLDGSRYVAHKTPSMTWDCVILVKSRELWDAWRTTVLGTDRIKPIGSQAFILAVSTALIIRIRMTRRQKESKRISSLVQVALDTLRNQELAYYTDPVSVPEPFLSSLQLRDLVLQDEHSVNERRRLWEQVERVVESNTNIRANLEEIEGGDEMRVWRWVGSTGRTPRKKELQ